MTSDLIAIARQAERGDTVTMTLTAGGLMVRGAPASQSEYIEAITDAAVDAAVAARRVRRRERDSERSRLRGDYLGHWQRVHADRADVPECLYFVGASAAHVAGGSARLPAIAIPIESVDAWWFGNVDWKTSGGGSFFVGGAIPVGD